MKKTPKNAVADQPTLLDEDAPDQSSDAQDSERAEAARDTATATASDKPGTPSGHATLNELGQDVGSGAEPRSPRQEPGDPVLDAAVASSLWAAWGDALGFISELTPLKGLGRRLNRDTAEWGEGEEAVARLLNFPPAQWPLHGTVGWRRRVGGRGGAVVDLPPGTYSDDTQLRLATSRSILDGRFDPEPFAFIELPVFASYGLGGGHATKAGASAMTKTNARWAVPEHTGWTDAGGNGVVMRVAPIAYAAVAHGSDLSDLLLGILRNAVVTHGHPRGLLPACLHAMVLAETLRHRQLAPMKLLHRWLDDLRDVPQLMKSDPHLRESLVFWEHERRQSYRAEWEKTVDEMHELLDLFSRESDSRGVAAAYLDAARSAGLFKEATRGSGTACFVAAYRLADVFQHDPVLGLMLAANAVGTDTDTIATIAGAHLGVVNQFFDPGPLLDQEYIAAETLRVMAPGHRQAAAHPGYPELGEWRAPKTQADFLGLDPRSGRVAVAGLGPGEYISRPFPAERAGEFAWQWVAADYGQTLLVKRRFELPVLPFTSLPVVETRGTPGRPTVEDSEELDDLRARAQRANAAGRKRSAATSAVAVTDSSDRRQVADDSRGRPKDRPAAGGEPVEPLTVETAVAQAEATQFSPEVVGVLLRDLSLQVSVDAAAVFLGYATAVWRGHQGPTR